MKTKIFWAVHPHEYYAIQLFNLRNKLFSMFEVIDATDNAVLVSAFPPHYRVKYASIDRRLKNREQKNIADRFNTYLFPSSYLCLGFPTVQGMHSFELWLQSNFDSTLNDSHFYLFGNCTEDCVQITYRALSNGHGFSRWTEDKRMVLDKQVQAEEFVDIIWELSWPKKKRAKIYTGLNEWYEIQTKPLEDILAEMKK